MNRILEFFHAGGLVMYPLLVFSVLTWVVIFEGWIRYRRLNQELRTFHLQVVNKLLQGDPSALQKFIEPFLQKIPTAVILNAALERMSAKDDRLRRSWKNAMERRRQEVNMELKKNFWILGTVASASPFVGLFGTVVGILQSFEQIASAGKGGFAVVAVGISEALVATAAGIVVAVIAVIAFNAFQTHGTRIAFLIRQECEEWAELLQESEAKDGV